MNLKDDETFLRNEEVTKDDTKSYTAQHAMVGYSTAKGNFTGDVLPGLASGSPRAALFGGQVRKDNFSINDKETQLRKHIMLLNQPECLGASNPFHTYQAPP